MSSSVYTFSQDIIMVADIKDVAVDVFALYDFLKVDRSCNHTFLRLTV